MAVQRFETLLVTLLVAKRFIDEVLGEGLTPFRIAGTVERDALKGKERM